MQAGPVFPRGTVFHDDVLALPPTATVAQRRESRQRWVARAREATRSCELVFFDPDNGLEVKSAGRHCRRGPKYAFSDELVPYARRGQSLVVYQHVARVGGTRHAQASCRLLHLGAPCRLARPFALIFGRGSCRVFLVLPAPAHAELLTARARRMLAGPWARHFELLGAIGAAGQR